MIHTLIGFDCGVKKLAYTIINIDSDFKLYIKQERVDLCDGKKVKEVPLINRIKKLKKILENIPFNERCSVFVEQQPPPRYFNTMMRQAISSNMEIEIAILSLIPDYCKLYRVNANLKSKIYICPKKGIYKITKQFKGDHKKFSIQNSKNFHELYGLEYKKSYGADEADSLLTIIAKLFT